MKDEGSKLKILSVCVLNQLKHTSAHTQGNPQDLHWGKDWRGFIKRLHLCKTSGIRSPWLLCFCALILVGCYWSKSWRSPTQSWRCCERMSHWRWAPWRGCELPASQRPLWCSQTWPSGQLHMAASRRKRWSPFDWPCTNWSGFEGTGWTWALDPHRIPQGRMDNSGTLA